MLWHTTGVSPRPFSSSGLDKSCKLFSVARNARDGRTGHPFCAWFIDRQLEQKSLTGGIILKVDNNAMPCHRISLCIR